MDAKDIPQVIVDLLDERAGKKHSCDGIVLTTLAEILTLYDSLRTDYSGQIRVRNLGLIGHPRAGATTIHDGIIKYDETPIAKLVDPSVEVIILD